MSQLRKNRAGPAPAWQRERLQRWLREWKSEQVLRTLKPDAEAEPGGTAPAAQSGTDGDLEQAIRLARPGAEEPAVEPGQVRLLAPDTPAAGARLWYVAVLNREAPDRLLIAPFGRFSEPAVPGELQTGRQTLHLRVLCLWNSREVEARAADRSWLIDTMSPGELAAADCVLRCVRRNEQVPEPVLLRTGPPLFHPDDPRHVYLRRERLRMDALVRERAEPAAGRSPACTYPAPESNLRLAAEDREEYGEDGDA